MKLHFFLFAGHRHQILYLRCLAILALAGDICVNSSDEEEEFDLDEAPKVVRKKPAAEAEATAAAKQDDAKETEKSTEPAASAAEPKKNDGGAVSLAPLEPGWFLTS